MSRALIILNSLKEREAAISLIRRAPTGSRVEVKGEKRSLPQNERMWAMLTNVATQKDHGGRRYTPDQWKVLFMHACGREVQFIPALDGTTFIPWGQRSSDLSKAEMSDLIEFMFVWGAENGVVWSDPDSVPASEIENAGRAA